MDGEATTQLASENGTLPDCERDLKAIFQELNVEDVTSALVAIRMLRTKNTDARPTIATVTQEEMRISPSDTRKMLEKIKVFSSKVDNLNGTIASMEDQLRHLYADRERLEREIGASEVDDVLNCFSSLFTMNMNLEAQLIALYADREYLDKELGKSEPGEIVEMFRNVSEMIKGAHRELATL